MRNGHHAEAERIELGDRIVIGIRDSARVGVDFGRSDVEFEVVGIVEDPDASRQYAVGYNEEADEFIVADERGQLIPDDSVAQEILNDFLEQAQPGSGSESGR